MNLSPFLSLPAPAHHDLEPVPLPQPPRRDEDAVGLIDGLQGHQLKVIRAKLRAGLATVMGNAKHGRIQQLVTEGQNNRPKNFRTASEHCSHI